MNKIVLFIAKVLALTALALIINSCIDLEEDVSSILTVDNLKSEGDIMAALSPIYKTYLDIVDKPHEQQIICFGGDDMTTWWAGNKAPLRVFDRFDFGDGENANIAWLDVAWNGYWKTIYYSNSLIEGLKTSSAPENIVKTAEGEARFFRALAYFNLVRSWGNVPEIIDGMEVTGKEIRSTVLSNYRLIEKDLLIAEDLLPHPSGITSAMAGKVTAPAATALLADLYLTWGGWPVKDATKFPLAAAKAKNVIDLNYYKLLPIEELWLLESQNGLESVFAIQFSTSENIISSVPTANSFHEARGFSDMYPERNFFLNFPEGPRKDYTFRTEIPQRKVVAGKIVINDPPTKPWQESQRNHPMYKKFTLAEDLTYSNVAVGFRAWDVIRYAEVLLIYAEAETRANGGVANNAALEALNQVKRRAAGVEYGTPNGTVDVVTATANDIVDERGWEFAGEYKRWFDLVRTERVAEIAAQRDPTEEVPLVRQSSEITWKQYIAPIPGNTILTSNLLQNPEGFVIQ